MRREKREERARSGVKREKKAVGMKGRGKNKECILGGPGSFFLIDLIE